MDELKAQLLEAYQRGDLFTGIESARRADVAGGRVATALATLHNDGQIDLIACFQGLQKETTAGIPFYLNASVFSSALASLISPIGQVMDCVAHLCALSVPSGPAGLLLEGFAQFCAKDPTRPPECLERIEANWTKYSELLLAVLHAGSQFDPDKYYGESIRLLETGTPDIRRRAAVALGALNAPKTPGVVEAVLSAFESAASSEQDGSLLASVVRSAVRIQQYDLGQESRAVTLIDQILATVNEQVLHAASELLASGQASMSDAVRDLLLGHLQQLKADRLATLGYVDFALSQMLKGPGRENAIGFIETYLRTHADLKLKVFDNTTHEIASDLKLLGTLLTRWFLRGDHVLREGIANMIGSFHGTSPHIEIDPAEIPLADNRTLTFLARKTVAYLILAPVVATDILISLMKQTDDDRLLEEIGSLLYDPLLISYPGSVSEHVTQQITIQTGKAQATLVAGHKTFQTYLTCLTEIPEIPALYPCDEQREADWRRSSRMMADSFKDAQKQSVFFNVIHRSVLLYGNRSIYHVRGQDGKNQRVETPMTSHHTSMELPRLDQIDPVGFDYLIRTLKIERIVK
jgi:hypothetical protein